MRFRRHERGLVGRGELVPSLVRGCVDLLPRGIGVEPLNRPPDTGGEDCFGVKIGNEALDLCVVE